jgi:hypothetical protein
VRARIKSFSNSARRPTTVSINRPRGERALSRWDRASIIRQSHARPTTAIFFADVRQLTHSNAQGMITSIYRSLKKPSIVRMKEVSESLTQNEPK